MPDNNLRKSLEECYIVHRSNKWEVDSVEVDVNRVLDTIISHLPEDSFSILGPGGSSEMHRASIMTLDKVVELLTNAREDK